MPHYLFFGASRNIGLHVVNLLMTPTSNATCTLLLRSPDAFIPANPTLASYVEKGQLRLFKGDATNCDDVARVWVEAGKGNGGKVDCILFSLGGVPGGMSLTKGFIAYPADICSSAIAVLLRHLYSLNLAAADQPRLVGITSMGLTAADHKKLPWWEKGFYGWALQLPHEDKLAMEYFVHHSAGVSWPTEQPIPSFVTDKEHSEGALQSLGQSGWLKDFIIVRPAFFIDATKKAAESRAPRVSDNFKKLPGTVSRKAVANFIVDECLGPQSKWSRRFPVVGW